MYLVYYIEHIYERISFPFADTMRPLHRIIIIDNRRTTCRRDQPISMPIEIGTTNQSTTKIGSGTMRIVAMMCRAIGRHNAVIPRRPNKTFLYKEQMHWVTATTIGMATVRLLDTVPVIGMTIDRLTLDMAIGMICTTVDSRRHMTIDSTSRTQGTMITGTMVVTTVGMEMDMIT